MLLQIVSPYPCLGVRFADFLPIWALSPSPDPLLTSSLLPSPSYHLPFFPSPLPISNSYGCVAGFAPAFSSLLVFSSPAAAVDAYYSSYVSTPT